MLHMEENIVIKILTNNAVENTNINGAAFNRFTAGNRDGYVVNVLNSGAMVHTRIQSH